MFKAAQEIKLKHSQPGRSVKQCNLGMVMFTQSKTNGRRAAGKASVHGQSCDYQGVVTTIRTILTAKTGVKKF